MNTITCPGCGQETPDHKLACPECGTDLTEIPRLDPSSTSVQNGSMSPAAEQRYVALLEDKIRAENAFKGSASNFHWIAGLSLLNSILSITGARWIFFIGLGVTQLIGAVGEIFAETVGSTGATAARAAAFALEVTIAAIFAGFGYFAQKRYRWAFVVGMILYALDGLAFLWAGDYAGLAFHGFILLGLYGGLKRLRTLQDLEGQLARRQARADGVT